MIITVIGIMVSGHLWSGLIADCRHPPQDKKERNGR